MLEWPSWKTTADLLRDAVTDLARLPRLNETASQIRPCLENVDGIPQEVFQHVPVRLSLRKAKASGAVGGRRLRSLAD
jgi:hypothetical protein